MIRRALVLWLLLGCDPEVSLDAGTLDGAEPMGRCPLKVIPSSECNLLSLTCPQDGLICQCRAYEWRCFFPDSGTE